MAGLGSARCLFRSCSRIKHVERSRHTLMRCGVRTFCGGAQDTGWFPSCPLPVTLPVTLHCDSDLAAGSILLLLSVPCCCHTPLTYLSSSNNLHAEERTWYTRFDLFINHSKSFYESGSAVVHELEFKPVFRGHTCHQTAGKQYTN